MLSIKLAMTRYKRKVTQFYNSKMHAIIFMEKMVSIYHLSDSDAPI